MGAPERLVNTIHTSCAGLYMKIIIDISIVYGDIRGNKVKNVNVNHQLTFGTTNDQAGVTSKINLQRKRDSGHSTSDRVSIETPRLKR